MGQNIQPLLDDLEATVDKETVDAQKTVSDLNAKIAELQAQVDAGTATDAQADQLARLKAKVEAIDPTNSGTTADVPSA